jgi:yecA family protein
MTEAPSNDIYRIKVTLRNVRPLVWRRIEVPADITLDRLHRVLQSVMGWADYHLHSFQVGQVTYGEPDPEPDFPDDTVDELGVRLDRIAGAGDSLVYEYDFGDDWEHRLEIEQVCAADREAVYPRCLAGKRACPPEDCGGTGGYAGLLAILADPQHQEYAETREWAGEDFDPEAFDLDAINAALGALDSEPEPDEEEDPYVGPDEDFPSAVPEFTEAHAGQLRAFLTAPGRPPDTLRYEELAGFVFAIACSPEMIMPSEWLPMIFNGQDAGYANLEEAQQVLAAMMALYNRTNHGLQGHRATLPPGIEPRAPAAANLDDGAALGLWARGFTAGHNYLDKLWDAYTPEPLNEELGGCMMVLSFFSSRKLAEAYRGEFERKEPTLEETAETMLRLFPDAMQSYAHIAHSIQTVLRAHRAPPTPARSEKIGRNAPCPCGSGKKYKKCCGATVH